MKKGKRISSFTQHTQITIGIQKKPSICPCHSLTFAHNVVNDAHADAELQELAQM